MVKVISCLLLITTLSVYIFSNAHAVSEDELSSEIASCYVAHKRSGTDFYNTGGADIYKKIISQLSGEQNVLTIINIAANKQRRQADQEGLKPNIHALKYCTKVEEKLLLLMAN
ncbi:hypothetical protein [Colwellia sp. RSH04]|uniref:hypothetical protein n=1 Tax=Colwellia sp. RSH04 TaxID=2305464 RepID=UPI000E58DF4D|nr:hypothetical protein [Colwellia sp. RSH04]RHW76581.1 hypothetical protein D1094_05695 [Colwellia sp. RSH04]